MKKIRKSKITKDEIVADLVFLAIGLLISFMVVFIFDIHWSFYPGNTLFPPSKYVGLTKNVYLTGSLIGAIVIFFITKLFLVGVKTEEKTWKKK